MLILLMFAVVFSMTPCTTGVDGTTATWPDEVIRPRSHDIQRIELAAGDYSARNRGQLNPVQACELVGIGRPILGNLNLWNWAPYQTDGYTIRGFRFTGTLDVRGSDCVIDDNEWHSAPRQPIRLRYGASRCTITNCLLTRDPPFADSDIVGIQLSDGKCLDNRIIGNRIFNYTDAIQTTGRPGDGYGQFAGLQIRNNHMGFTDTVRTLGGSENIPGCENVLDFKAGGTAANPVVISNNVLFGVRPNAGNPGYAITLHRLADHIQFRGNTIVNCEIGVFLNIQYRNADQLLGEFRPTYAWEQNTFVDIRPFGSERWPTTIRGKEFIGHRLPQLQSE